MSDLSNIVLAFSKEQMSFSEFTNAVDALLEKHPEKATQLFKALRIARELGLPMRARTALRKKLGLVRLHSQPIALANQARVESSRNNTVLKLAGGGGQATTTAFEWQLEDPEQFDIASTPTMRRDRPHRSIRRGGHLVLLLLIFGIVLYYPTLSVLRTQQQERIVSHFDVGTHESISAGFASVRALPNTERKGQILADERIRGALLAFLHGDPPKSVSQGVALIRSLDPTSRETLLNLASVKSLVIDHFAKEISQNFDPTNNLFNFAQARDLVTSLKEMYAESPRVVALEERLALSRAQGLNELSSVYEAKLSQGDLLDGASAPTIVEILEKVERLDRWHPMLRDTRLKTRFVASSREAMNARDLELTSALLTSAGILWSDDPVFQRLESLLAEARTREKGKAFAATLVAPLQRAIDGTHSLSGLIELEEQYAALTIAEPNNPLLAEFRARVFALVKPRYDAAVARNDWTAAREILRRAVPFMTAEHIYEQRRRMDDAGALLVDTTTNAERYAQLLTTLLARPTLSAAWQWEFATAYKHLLVLVGTGHPSVKFAANTVGLLFHDKALQLLEDEQFVLAHSTVARGMSYLPRAKKLSALHERLTSQH